MKTLADRLAWAMKAAGLDPQSSQSELARLVGAPCRAQNIQSILSGSQKTSKYTPKIAQVLGCDGVWLAEGVGDAPVLQGKHKTSDGDALIKRQRQDVIGRLLPAEKGNVVVWERPEDLEPDENRVWIDRYDYHFSAGTGLIQWEVREKKALPFDVGFFKALGSKPKDCKLLTVRGDSMEPFLFNRDMMMIDSTKVHVRDGKVYAIYFEDEPLVKLIFKQVGGGILLHSYNSKYPDRIVPAESMELVKIVGEVIYRSGSAMAGGN